MTPQLPASPSVNEAEPELGGRSAPTSLAPPPPRLGMGWPRRIGAALFVLAIAAVTALSLRPRPPVPVAVQVVEARRGPITRVVTAAGKLQAATEVKLSANVSGDLLELDAHEGDRVARGQVLGRIDSRRYAAQVAQAEAARASAAADVEGEKVKVNQLAQDLARVERLAGTGNASGAEVENARAALDGERSRHQAAQERVQQSDAALSEARHNLSLTTLVSPIEGVITKREKQVGERVRGSDLSEDVVLIVSTLSSMEARIEVGEHEVVYVEEGHRAEVEIDAFPDRRFPAQVVEVARNATIKNQGTEGGDHLLRPAGAHRGRPGGAARDERPGHHLDRHPPGRGGGAHPGGHGPAGPGPDRRRAGAGGAERALGRRHRAQGARSAAALRVRGRGRQGAGAPGGDRAGQRERDRDHQRAQGRRAGGGGPVPDPVPRPGRREGGGGGEERKGWEGMTRDGR